MKDPKPKQSLATVVVMKHSESGNPDSGIEVYEVDARLWDDILEVSVLESNEDYAKLAEFLSEIGTLKQKIKPDWSFGRNLDE